MTREQLNEQAIEDSEGGCTPSYAEALESVRDDGCCEGARAEQLGLIARMWQLPLDRVERDSKLLVLIGAQERSNPVAVWMHGYGGEPTGGLVVSISGLVVKIENMHNQCFLHINVNDIREIEEETP